MKEFFLNKIEKKYYSHVSKKLYPKIEHEYNLSRDEQKELNLQRRIALVKHAYNTIPFYHKKYSAAGVNINSIKTDADFAQLPPLTKTEVRNNYRDMIAATDSLDSLYVSATGGSTGVPVRFYHDPAIPNRLLGWPAVSQLGIEVHDPFGQVARGKPTLFRECLHDFVHYSYRIAYLDANQPIDSDSMSNFADKLIRIKAKYIRGYVGGIIQFALFCKQQKITIPSLQLIWTSSAPLPEFQRNMLQEIFGCKAYTQYGCCEIPWLGIECRKQCGIHIFPTMRHIEITDQKGAPVPRGEMGNVVITDLLNFRFPLIRYINGDRSSFLTQECDCGNASPLLNYIQGRVTDCINLSDGSILFGDYLTTAFDQYPEAVQAFQFHQIIDGTIFFRIVKNDNYTNASQEIENVITRFQHLVAGRNKIVLEYCSEICADRGKTRFIINDFNTKDNNADPGTTQD